MNVCVIGGGAGGMMAALTAAEQGHRVTVLERQARVGRKLMATGNGRCNLTNLHAAPEYYQGGRDFCACALGAFTAEDTLRWFARQGLMTAVEDSGRVYPYSNMAGSVLDVLRFALERAHIDVRTGAAVTQLRKSGGVFTVETAEDTLAFERVILAAGGAAGGKVGGVTDGYKLGEMLGHHRTALYPSLVQLTTETAYPRALKGVKAEAAVSVLRGATVLARRRGEILFTEYGVSGPAVFDVSRAAATGGKGLTVCLDFLPDQQESAVADWLVQRREQANGREAGSLLTGALPTRLGQMVCKAAGFTTQQGDTLTHGQLGAIARQVKCFSLPVTGVCGFDQAQVTAGGLTCGEFDSATMESRLVPGFYACGEVLDVDGDCGGYNLQWAWSSGHMAGLLGSAAAQ